MIFQIIPRKVYILRIDRNLNYSKNFRNNYDAAEIRDRCSSVFANDDYRCYSWDSYFEKSECWQNSKTLSTMSH